MELNRVEPNPAVIHPSNEMLFLLYETSAGFALFQVDDKKPIDAENISPKLFKLTAFEKFENTAAAVDAASNLVEGKMNEVLKSFLKKNLGKKEGVVLAVADAKLGTHITKKFESVQAQCDAVSMEMFRCVRENVASLLSELEEGDVKSMTLGLSHSLSRHKFKFSPDKVDTMIVQAISLLDDLDKELNTYCMRLKEWYGWHFPEMAKIVADNVLYARIVHEVGQKDNVSLESVGKIVEDEALQQQLVSAADISMGTEISEGDLLNIDHLAQQVINISQYRAELYDYLSNRMRAIAPNLTAMVGELVGARLIAHAGSLMNLAKHPASTVQILGAEKALFRALKSKHDTPKYGLLFHASLVGQAAPKLKGKISRVLAAKTALAIRVDALSERSEEAEEGAIGIKNRKYVEERLKQLENAGRGKSSSLLQTRNVPLPNNLKSGASHKDGKDFSIKRAKDGSGESAERKKAKN